MIHLTKIRELNLVSATTTGRPEHLSAASGLVRTASQLYVLADNELHLGVFPARGLQAGRLMRLFDGALLDKYAPRKARKPDLETLARLPSFAGYAHGALLAFGSGSKAQRRRGALLALDARGEVAEDAESAKSEDRVREINLSAFYGALDEQVSALNIEGSFVDGHELCLLQRGNKNSSANALIRFALAPLLDALAAHADLPALPPLSLHAVALDDINGTPLTFTEGAALPNGDIVFSAVAENTQDHYNDGPCLGAAIGVMTRNGKLRCLHPLNRPHKIEGIDARMDGDCMHLLLVTDDDNAAKPAALFSATLALPPGGTG